jgi:hypothetical protein
MAHEVEIVHALLPGALRVGYSGIPEDEEKERLQLEWRQDVKKVNYRGTEYWIPLENKKQPEKQPEKKTEKGKPKDN